MEVLDLTKLEMASGGSPTRPTTRDILLAYAAFGLLSSSAATVAYQLTDNGIAAIAAGTGAPVAIVSVATGEIRRDIIDGVKSFSDKLNR